MTIKEGRKLLLMPPETPLSPIHLENMLNLARIGVAIAPSIPAFYIKPKSILELVDHQVGKIIDRLGFPHRLFRRWGEDPAPEK